MSKREIIMHCFQWKLKDITKNLDKIKENNFTSIQVSPAQGTKNNGNEFWLLYQPLDMAFVDSEQIGTREDLIELCREAHKRDLKVCVDVVLRHVAGVDTGELKPHEKVADRLKNNPNFWTNAENANNYSDRYEVTRKSCGMPMTEYNNEKYQDLCIEFLDDLKSIGVDFFRLDQLKHYQLPREGSNFLTRVFGRYKNDGLTYGEALECSRELLDEYTEYMNVLSDGEVSEKNKDKFVTYIESHDTFHTWKIGHHTPDSQLTNEWRCLLESNRKSHVLFFCRPFSNLWQSDEIKWINREFR